MNVRLPVDTKTWLVGRAEEILDAVKDKAGFTGQTAQLRNLLQITQTESEIAVLRNFIRYQTGRKATKTFWLLLYEEVLQVLGQIGERFPDEADRRSALQSFFGYLVRHYVYLNELLSQGKAKARRSAAHSGALQGGDTPRPAGQANR